MKEFAVERLQFLIQPNPPVELFGDEMIMATSAAYEWNEQSIKNCLYLYFSLMPANHLLIHPLVQIFIQSSVSEVKRTILKMLEIPIKKMGMQSAELMKLIEEFPQGAETLVLRCVHILTEKTQPSVELVNKVRFLYEKKLSDVRFLIPILSGLTKV
jgi:symplekin